MVVGARTNWLLFNETAASDRTSRLRPRRLAKSLNEQRRRSRWTHGDELGQARKLMLDSDRTVPFITRPRFGCCWGAVGSALRVFDHAADRSNPFLLNESTDCLNLRSAIPDFSAVGARCLLPNLKHRIVFEVSTEPTAKRHVSQVGLAQVTQKEGLSDAVRCLDELTPLNKSIVWTSTGDVYSSDGAVRVVKPGVGCRSLRQALGSETLAGVVAAPSWLEGEDGGPRPRIENGRTVSRVFLEVDLSLGRLSMSVGEWAEDSGVVRIDALLENESGQWLPFVSLTAVGQRARIIDYSICGEF